MSRTALPRLRRVLAAGSVGALLAVGLSVIPATTVQAQVVRHTRAGEVAGPLDGSEIRQLPFPTRHAALYWAGNPDAEVTVSFSSDGVSFGEAFPVEHDEVGMQRNNGETYGAVLPAGNAVKAMVTSDRPLGRLTILALADGGTSVTNTRVPGVKPAGAQTAQPNIVSRSAWGADEALRFNGPTEVWPPVFQTVQKLVVHHTAGKNDDPDPVATINSIYYYHAVTQGWGDIGYNFLIDEAGHIYKGRHSHTTSATSPTANDDTISGENAGSQGVTAGHAYGYNSGTVGVALLGDLSTQDAKEPAKGALREFLKWKASGHGLDVAKVSTYTNPVNGTQKDFENVPGHREVPENATECPGGYFHINVLPAMRSELRSQTGTADTAAPWNASELGAKVNKRSVNLTWKASEGDTGSGGGISGVAGYDVYRKLVGATQLTRVGGTTGVAYTDNVTGPRKTYDYVVKAYDGAANRSTGVTVRVTA